MMNASVVVSWIKSVDDQNREELLRTVKGWNNSASDLLKEELIAQYEGRSVLDLTAVSLDKTGLLKAISYLYEDDIPSLSALVAGLFLINQRI
ncbi:MAG: hypothetical protein NWE76_01410 [Candidatus Bathyarchaeota archaeon]|nr:hypothetical protein [Candidatus Bathyarchaeota archaeon]